MVGCFLNHHQPEIWILNWIYLASTSKRLNSVQRSAKIKEESCETDYDRISEGNYSGFHSEFVDVKEEPSVSSHIPNAFQGGNDLHSYIFNASLPHPHPSNEDFSRYLFQVHHNCNNSLIFCFYNQNFVRIGSRDKSE